MNRDSIATQELRMTPFRPLNDFLLDATWNVPNFSDFPRLNNRIVSNLIYYQTNYFVFGIALFLLVGYVIGYSELAAHLTDEFFSRINYPVDFLFGLVVVAALLMAFIYISSSPRVGNNALASVEHVFRSAKEDRPILVIIAILGVSYLILSFVGKLLIFFLGIVLPVQGESRPSSLHLHECCV